MTSAESPLLELEQLWAQLESLIADQTYDDAIEISERFSQLALSVVEDQKVNELSSLRLIVERHQTALNELASSKKKLEQGLKRVKINNNKLKQYK